MHTCTLPVFIPQGTPPIYSVCYTYYCLTGVIQAYSTLHFLRVHCHCSFLLFFIYFFEWCYKVDGSVHSLHSSKPVWKMANKRRSVEVFFFFFFSSGSVACYRLRVEHCRGKRQMHISKWYFKMQFKISEKERRGKKRWPLTIMFLNCVLFFLVNETQRWLFWLDTLLHY